MAIRNPGGFFCGLQPAKINQWPPRVNRRCILQLLCFRCNRNTPEKLGNTHLFPSVFRIRYRPYQVWGRFKRIFNRISAFFRPVLAQLLTKTKKHLLITGVFPYAFVSIHTIY